MQGNESIIDQAISRHLAQRELPDTRWEEFIDWLEASPAHAQAYDRIAAQDHALDDVRFPVRAANDDAPVAQRPRWGWAAGGIAVAAALTAVLVPLATPPRGSTVYDVATRAGERRTVAMADGTTIELSGGTRLRLDRAAPRFAALEAGEATLHVKHDAANPFTVTMGGVTVRDMGTVFDLARNGDTLSVAVSEGSVLFAPEREAVTLRAGDGLVMREHSRAMTRAKVAPESVGGWRTGVLSFDGQPVGDVFESIHRLYATEVVLDDGLSHRPFTGIVRMTGVADRDVPHLAALIGATWRRDGKRWILADGETASR